MVYWLLRIFYRWELKNIIKKKNYIFNFKVFEICTCFVWFSSRFLYTGLIPSPIMNGGMMTIFYFLNATHTESAFRISLQKFFNDVKKVQTSTPLYKNCLTKPAQVITDMSLVIFRPCLGNHNFTCWTNEMIECYN